MIEYIKNNPIIAVDILLSIIATLLFCLFSPNIIYLIHKRWFNWKSKDIETNTNNISVEFLKWCNTPVYRAAGELGFRLRVQPQFPEYDTYIVIDKTGYSVLGEGVFLTSEEVYDYWLKESKNKL